MARNECAAGKHIWKDRRKPGEQVCTVCGTHWPCDERDCGHVCCFEFRLGTETPPICTFCRRRVDGLEGNVSVSVDGATRFKQFVIGVRGRPKTVCKTCYNKPREESKDEGHVQGPDDSRAGG